MSDEKPEDIKYRQFEIKDGVTTLIKMIENELSEPYSIFLYRHFVNDYPELTIVATYKEEMIGCIVGKIEGEDEDDKKGYIAMLVVLSAYRKKGIGRRLVLEFAEKCKQLGVYQVELETECVNKGALRLYEGKKSKKGVFSENRFLVFFALF